MTDNFSGLSNSPNNITVPVILLENINIIIIYYY